LRISLNDEDDDLYSSRSSSSISSTVETINCFLSVVVYHQQGFLIGKFRVENGPMISAKGSMVNPVVGNTYKLTGKYESSAKYGQTFAFDSYSSSLPTSPEAIIGYIDRARWIGVQIAHALVDRYGSETLTVLKNSPEEVAREINGITLERAFEISKNLRDNEAVEASEINLREALRGVQLGKRTFSTIVRRYGSDAASIVVGDPYRLAREIEGVSFVLADRIARKHGLPEDSPARILAGVRHVLLEASFDGHTFLPRLECGSEARRILDLSRQQIDAVLDAKRGQLDDFVQDIYVSADGTEIAVEYLRRAEENVARRLIALNRAVDPIVPGDLTGLFDDQAEAVESALRNGVFVLLGNPGTGKTSTISFLTEKFDSSRVVLCAPSGKAARRISELTRKPAYTIHSLLEARPTNDSGGFFFARNAENPLDADLVVMDETSMTDVVTMSALVDALREGTRLILIGDPYQLPSVGAGNVLKDLVNSGVIPSKELTIIKRQNPGLIIESCAAIKDGNEISFDTALALHQKKDLHFIEATTQHEVQVEILEAVEAYLNAVTNPLRDVQVLTALREKTDLSVRALNSLLRDFMNDTNRPSGPPRDFWDGDKVIQTKNDYQLQIMNGDIGFVETTDFKAKLIHVRFEDPLRLVAVPLNEHRLELAYALTVHRFQGSQAPIIIIAVHSCLGALVPNRPWAYTAISRAQKLCLLVGEKDAFKRMIQRNQPAKRWTKLRKLVQDFAAESPAEPSIEPIEDEDVDESVLTAEDLEPVLMGDEDVD
jgi:exodeoxyribonuclease V alpha subunit